MVRYSGRMRIVSIVIIAATVLALPAFGQDWALHRIEDQTDLRETSEARIAEGFTPVGLDISADLGLTMLYARLGTWEADSYAIEEIPSLDLLNEVVTGRIREGWFPMDFSFSGESNALLFTSSEDVIDGWRLISTEASTIEVQRTIAEYQTEGFTPVGIAALENGQLALLLLDLPEQETPAPIIMGVSKDPEEAVVAIQSTVEDGWTPLSVTTTDSQMIVLFLRL